MTDTKSPPSGPMLSVLRRMLSKPLTATTDGPRLWGTIGGEHVSAVTLGGMLKRGLIRVSGNSFILTADGERWARGQRK